MIAIKAAGNIEIDEPSLFQAAESIPDGLHRDACPIRTSRAVKPRADKTTLTEGRQPDGLFPQRLIEARRTMRTADHHFLVDLDGKLRLTDARMEELRCDDIQDRLMDTSRALHLRDFIGTFPKAQILHDIIQRQRRPERKMLLEELHPVQCRLLCFYIDPLRDM